MSDAPDDPMLTALRERASNVASELDATTRDCSLLEARLAEINTAIEIVVRNGRKKPGPKPGPRAGEVATASEPAAGLAV